MTLKEQLVNLGQDNGLLQQQAEQIVDVLIAEDDAGHKIMTGRWNDDADGYPPKMIDVLWGSYKNVAAKWLAEHAPRHWARPVFDGA